MKAMTEGEAKKILFLNGFDREQIDALWILLNPYVEGLILEKLAEFVEGFIERAENIRGGY